MPLRDILANSTFNPEMTVYLGETFELAWSTLQAANPNLSTHPRKELARELLAIRVLALIRIGTHGREQVVARAVAAVQFEVSPPPVLLRANQTICCPAFRAGVFACSEARASPSQEVSVLCGE
jgi:hypothetical protein